MNLADSRCGRAAHRALSNCCDLCGANFRLPLSSRNGCRSQLGIARTLVRGRQVSRPWLHCTSDSHDWQRFLMSITVLTRRRIKGKPHSVKSLLGVAIVSCMCALSANGAEPYTAEAMWKLKRLADPAIAPDGRLAVVSVTAYDISANKGDS